MPLMPSAARQPGQVQSARRRPDRQQALPPLPRRHATVAGTQHDLRKTNPTTRNSLGQTADNDGPCSACHTPHQAAQTPLAGPGDPSGQCLTCHQDGRVATASGSTHFNHPAGVDRSKLPGGLTLVVASDTSDPDRADLTCATCHNPHDAAKGRFLCAKTGRAWPIAMSIKAASLAGSHDFTKSPPFATDSAKPSRNPASAGSATTFTKAAARHLDRHQNFPADAADMCVAMPQLRGIAANHPAPAFSHPTGVDGLGHAAVRYPAAPLRRRRRAAAPRPGRSAPVVTIHTPTAPSPPMLLRVHRQHFGPLPPLPCGKVHALRQHPRFVTDPRLARRRPPARISAWPAIGPTATIRSRNCGLSPRGGRTPADGICIAVTHKTLGRVLGIKSRRRRSRHRRHASPANHPHHPSHHW